ncbi:MAG: Ig-like domain-containing protein [Gemmatimonadaceae bacterium]
MSFRERKLVEFRRDRRPLVPVLGAVMAAIILASCGGDSGTAPRVKAPPKVVRVAFAHIVDSVEVERTTPIVVTCVDSTSTQVLNCPITWSVTDTSVATVSASGTVTGVHAGTTELDVLTGNGVHGALRIVVLPPAIASVIFSSTLFTMNEGDTLTIPTPTITDRTGATVSGRTPTYRAITSTLSVTPTGLVSALAPGGGSIVATVDTVSVTLSFNVVAIPVGRVKILPGVLDLGVGHTIATQSSAYAASGRQLTKRTYTYSVDNPSVATVSATGIVTGVGAGTAKLTVSTGEGSTTAPISVAVLATHGFVIDLQFVGTVSQTVRDAAQQAAQTWEKVISAPLIPYHVVVNAGDCGTGVPAVNQMETSLLIIIQQDSIDGPGKTVGLGGPCVLRDDAPQLTALGTLTIDKADVSPLSQEGILVGVVTHEMGHILGIGTLWGDPQFPGFVGLADGLGGENPVFTGSRARGAAAALGFTTDSTVGVPIENTGKVGDGTRDAHWRASVFGHELMTGTIHAGLNPISLVTIQALGDFGYSVVPEAADDFDVLNATSPGSYIVPSLSIGTQVRETVLFPRFTVTRSGRLRPIPGARQPKIR